MPTRFPRPLLALTALLLVTLPALSDAPATQPATLAPPITTGLQVATCAHSFHVFVPPAVAELAALAGITGHKQLQTNMIGGSFVSQHWDILDAQNKVKTALATGKVDVLTLSPIYFPDDGIEKFVNLALQHNPNTRILLQESWLPFDFYDPATDHGIAAWRDRQKNHPKVDHNAMTAEKLESFGAPYAKEFSDFVQALNKKLGKTAVFVVPAGHAVQTLREKIIAGQAPGIKTQEELFADAIGHPKPVLAALVSYTNFAVIYRRSPVGLPKPAALKALPDDLNTLLQQIAWTAATTHPQSGLTAAPSAPAK